MLSYLFRDEDGRELRECVQESDATIIIRRCWLLQFAERSCWKCRRSRKVAERRFDRRTPRPPRGIFLEMLSALSQVPAAATFETTLLLSMECKCGMQMQTQMYECHRVC